MPLKSAIRNPQSAIAWTAVVAAGLLGNILAGEDEPKPVTPPTAGPERPKIRRWLDDPSAPVAPPSATQPISPDAAPRTTETPEPEPLVRTEPAIDLDDPEVVARRATMRAVIKDKLADAKRAYKAGDFRRAEAIARNILQADPRNTNAADIIRSARAKMTEADETIADMAGERRDREGLLEAQEHGVLPPPRLPTVRPRLPRRDEDVETIRRKKMSERLDEHIKSMDFMKADLDWVFNTLFILTGVNIIADPKALEDKSLTIHVDDIPLRAVLDFIVRNNKGITYSVTEDAIFITANDADDQKSLMYPKVYPLHHGLVSADPNEAGKQGGGGGGGPNGSGAGKTPTPPKQPKGQQGGGSGKERSYLETVLKWMQKDGHSLPDGSEYMVDDQSNQLIVFTTPAGHDRIAKFLDYFDQPAIQVLIKTRVLELSAENEKQLGFNLDNLVYHGVGLSTTGTTTGVSTGVSTDTSISTGISTGVSVSTSTSTAAARNSATVTGGATSFLPGNLGPGTIFQFVGSRTDPKFQITLSMLMNSRFTKVLSEPQVLAINNKEATISVKTGFHYITDLRPLQQNIVTGIGTQVPNTSSFIPTFGDDSVGFTLTVTPSVGRDLKTINLHINPYIDALAEGQQIQNFQSFQVGTGNAGSVQPAIQQPTKDQTELETDVVIEDNGYVILGGLMRTRREIRKREVPGFSKIPLLGNLFKSTSTDVTKDNLVIIVEAQIITPTGRTYYKDPAPDDANVREGGVIRAPLQTSDAKRSDSEDEAISRLATQRDNPPPPADVPEAQPEPRHTKAQAYSKPAAAARNDNNDAPYTEQTQTRMTARERMEKMAKAARAAALSKPKPSEWNVSPEESVDGHPVNAQPAAPAAPEKPDSKGEVLGPDKD